MTDDINVTIAEEQSIIVALENGVGQDTKSVKVSSNDTNDNYLQTKLVAGNDITISVNNEGANETLTISTTAQPAGNYFDKTNDDTDDINDTATNRFTNDIDIARLANTSGTNTGDVSVVDSSEIDFTLTGQQITASIKSGSIDETKLDTSVNASLDLADSAIQTELDPIFTAHPAYGLTSQDLIDIGNLSGTNTGDQDLSPYELLSNKSTDINLGTSDTLYPSQKAVKTYADNVLGNANALVYKGVIDCSTNPNYPAADAGHLYIVSVAGKIGGASGVDVEVGDMCICNTDGTVSGDQATVGNKWNIVQKNIIGAVTGPASAVGNNVVFFDGVTGKVIKDSGLTLSGTNTGDETQSTIKTKLGNASNSTDGYLTSIDWNTFNGKQDTLGFTPLNIDQTTPQTITATDTTITASDEIYFGDATDSFKIKKDTIQGILDLTPAPDLSGYAKLSGATFTGDVSANNLSGTNTGDQDLTSYALKTDYLALDQTTPQTTVGTFTFPKVLVNTTDDGVNKLQVAGSTNITGRLKLGGAANDYAAGIIETTEKRFGLEIRTLHGLEADGYRIDYARIDNFGPRFIVIRSRGSLSSPSALRTNDQIFYIDGRAFGTVFGDYVAQMSIEASANHSSSSTPGKFVFKVQPSGKRTLATLVNAFNIDATGTYISDGIKHYLGTAKDVSVTYNGTDTIFTNEVGSGEFQFGGVVKATGYKSSDGSAGITTTFVDADGNTIGVKDGLIVSKTAP